MLAVLAFAAWSWRGASVDRIDEDSTVAEVVALAENDQYGEAFRLALPLVRAGRLEEDAELREVWQ